MAKKHTTTRRVCNAPSKYSQGYLKSSGPELSAIGGQLLKQRGQHALQLGRTLREFRVILGLDELQILGQQQVILQLARRSHGNGAEAGELHISVSAAAFSEIGWDRSTASSQLTGQAVEFLARERGGDLIHRQGQLMRLLPDL